MLVKTGGRAKESDESEVEPDEERDLLPLIVDGISMDRARVDRARTMGRR